MSGGLRILMVSPQFRPLVGGYERAAERLAAGLVADGHEVTVLAERRNPGWPPREDGPGYGVRRLWCIYRPHWHLLTALPSFATYLLLNARHFQVIHVQQYGALAALAIGIAHLFSKPVIVRTTSTRSKGIVQVLAGRSPGQRLMAALHRSASAYIVTTLWARDEVVEFGVPPERIRVIPNGIDTDAIAPDASARRTARERLVPGAEGVLVLYCGRLDEVKNPLGLIRAWRTVAAAAPAAQLVLVGGGPQQEAARQLVERQGLGHCVRLAGEQADVLPWYRAADLYVLPSHLEGLSNALIEAMSCGLPVVSTKVSGSVEILAAGDMGELVEVDDELALASAILRLIDAPARRNACGARARQYAEQTFSIRAVVRETVGLYRQVINRAGPFQ